MCIFLCVYVCLQTIFAFLICDVYRLSLLFLYVLYILGNILKPQRFCFKFKWYLPDNKQSLSFKTRNGMVGYVSCQLPPLRRQWEHLVGSHGRCKDKMIFCFHIQLLIFMYCRIAWVIHFDQFWNQKRQNTLQTGKQMGTIYMKLYSNGTDQMLCKFKLSKTRLFRGNKIKMRSGIWSLVNAIK